MTNRSEPKNVNGVNYIAIFGPSGNGYKQEVNGSWKSVAQNARVIRAKLDAAFAAERKEWKAGQ